MARRPVFLPTSRAPFTQVQMVEFEWFAGFALAQKQRSIQALHAAAQSALGIDQILEVSTKSTTRLGTMLSAFRLSLTSEHLGHSLTVEAAFQGSKVYAEWGKHPELYELEDGREIRRRVSSHAGEAIKAFEFEGRTWATVPRTAFYDWIYLRALREQVRNEVGASGQSTLHRLLVTHDGFTDIEFNPEKSINCQARSCALYVALHRQGSLIAVDNPDDYLQLIATLPGPPEPSSQESLFEP